MRFDEERALLADSQPSSSWGEIDLDAKRQSGNGLSEQLAAEGTPSVTPAE